MHKTKLFLILICLFLSNSCALHNAVFNKPVKNMLNVCVKVDGQTDETVTINISKDTLTNIARLIIKRTEEELNEHKVGTINDKIMTGISCENKEIWLLQFKIDILETQDDYMVGAFASVATIERKLKYRFTLEDSKGKIIFSDKNSESDRSVADLVDKVGSTMAGKVLPYLKEN